MEYKLLVLDLDGTLTNSKKEITQHTLDVLLRAQETKGLRIALCSGRPTYGIVPLAEKLQLKEHDGFILAFNGGKIISCKDGQTLHHNVLDPAILPYIYECSHKNDHTDRPFGVISYDGPYVFTETPDNEYINYECFLNKMSVLKVDDFLETAQKELRPKCLIVGDPEPLHELELEMREKIGETNGVYRSEAFFLEVVPKNVDKALSLSVLLEKIGLTKEQMICIGDGYNDQSMIEYAGLGVAMSNAKPEVKEVADYITLSNEEDGVAAVVEKFIL